MSDTYCPLPWMHLGTHPHGGVTLCCISDHTDGLNRARNYTEDGIYDFLNLNKNTIDEHMNSDYYKKVRLEMLAGKKPKACMRCYDEESKNIKSKRQSETENYPANSLKWAQEVTAPDGKINNDLRFVELRMGNVCNVRCRTCNPASSSKWVKDYNILVEKADFVNKNYLGLNYPDDFAWPEMDSFYEDLYENAPNMEVLYINGGEPTLIKAHWKYLQRLVDSGKSKNVTLWYNINMTNLPEGSIDIWKEFKETRVCCSIDDLGERNAFMRKGTDWETVEKHLAKLLEAKDDLTLRITQTVSAYNYATIPEFFAWADDLGIPVDMNFVYDPDYLSPSVIPPEVRRAIHNDFRGIMGNDHRLGTLLSMYNNDDWDSLKWEHFCRFNDLLDERDSYDWRSVLTKLVDYVDNNGHTSVFVA